MTTKAQISQVLGVLGVAYRRQAMNAREIKLAVPVWHELLGDIDFELLQAAVHDHCANSKWFPSIAELREAAFQLAESDADKLTAGEAWAEVKRALSAGRHNFQSGARTWSSPIVEKAFRAVGGWSYFGYALTNAEMADRARFMQAFQEIQARETRQERMVPALQDFRRQHLLGAGPQGDGDAGRLPGDEVYPAGDRIKELTAQLRPPASPKNGRPDQYQQ